MKRVSTPRSQLASFGSVNSRSGSSRPARSAAMQPCAAAKNSRVSRSAWRSALCGSRTSFRCADSSSRNLSAASSRCTDNMALQDGAGARPRSSACGSGQPPPGSERRMLPVKIGSLLERVREQQNLRLSEQLAGQVQRRRRALRETVRHADHGMTSPVGERLIAADEEIEIAERGIELLHDAHAQAVGLDELHGWDEVPGADLVGAAALLGP